MIAEVSIGFWGQVALAATAFLFFLGCSFDNKSHALFCALLFVGSLVQMTLEDLGLSWDALTLGEVAMDGLMFLVVVLWAHSLKVYWMALAGIFLGLQIVWRAFGLLIDGLPLWAHVYNGLYYLALLSCLGGILAYAGNYLRGGHYNRVGWSFAGRNMEAD